MKKLGVPVLANVAAILRPMMPDLPMPQMMTRPCEPSTCSTASVNCPSSLSASAATADASICRTRLADAM